MYRKAVAFKTSAHTRMQSIASASISVTPEYDQLLVHNNNPRKNCCMLFGKVSFSVVCSSVKSDL